MKKIISLFLALLMVFSLISCADNKIDPPETTGNGPEVTTQPETTEAPVGEYVLRHKFADIDEVLERPEIEVDRSRLKDFYIVTEDTSSFHGKATTAYIAISVKGYGEDRTEFVINQETSMELWEDNNTITSISQIIILDNVNKTFKVCEAQSMDGVFEDIFGGSTDAETTESDNLEENLVNGFLDLFGTVFSGEYRDASERYTYEKAKMEMDSILAMYTGIGFFEFMQKNYPDVKFTKRPDEGGSFVYKTEIDGNELRFKFDRETGLFDHASYTGREHFEVTEYSFTECFHTDSDIPDIAK